jgi:L-seryl-tRNA(Ser) seleniumtransferase
MRLRDLPSVDELARSVDDPLAVDAARTVLTRAREAIAVGGSPGDLAALLQAELRAARAPRLRRVLNATGVIVHTNLGRAPLAAQALERVTEAARGYSNLEYDLAGGHRGSRQEHVVDALRRLTGAEAALVVNNNAAAVLLALAALAEGREVLVSRGELIEIGDGFRIPDVLARSGARLREVGTTNRTRASDYERAVGPETGALLRVHQSNFRVVGFTEQPTVAELAAVARRHGVPLVDDLGSGVLVALEDEPSARESLAAGADLVCFSGDKLLGGPQAGVVVGRAELVERLRRHPLQRAVRADKLTLAALEGTLALYLEPARAAREVPVLRMLGAPAEAVRARAARLAEAVGGEVEETVARAGGGALPLAEVASFACAVEEELAGPLRAGEPPVVGIVRDGRLLLDCRTLADAEVEEVAAAVAAARRARAAAGDAEPEPETEPERGGPSRAAPDEAPPTSSPLRS